MPQIASHHAQDPWRPKCAWPDSCYVQWGSGGLVMRNPGKGGPYRTAFFEAFPGDESGGFIRGEGETVEAAEAKAFEKWRRESSCSHRWGRNARGAHYLNGGAICWNCGAFKTVFKPVHELGYWRKPLEAVTLDSVMSGFCARSPWSKAEDDDSRKWRRKLLFRSRLHGIAVPTPPEGVLTEESFEAYAAECRKVVLMWYAERVAAYSGDGDPWSIGGFFESFAAATLKREAERDGYLPVSEADSK